MGAGFRWRILICKSHISDTPSPLLLGIAKRKAKTFIMIDFISGSKDGNHASDMVTEDLKKAEPLFLEHLTMLYSRDLATRQGG